MTFQERDILTDTTGTMLLRILITHPDKTVLFDLANQTTAFPEFLPTASIEEKLSDGVWNLLGRDQLRRRTAGAADYARKSFARFQSAFNDPQSLLSERGRAAKFRLLKKEDPKLQYKTFLKILRLWWASGSLPSGLIPAFDRCGHVRIDTTNLKAISVADAKEQCRKQAASIDVIKHTAKTELARLTKEGKPRKRREAIAPTGYQVDRYTLRIFVHYWAQFRSGPGKTLISLHKDLCREVFSRTDPVGQTIELDTQCLPSIDQFKWWYRKLNNHKSRRLDKIPDRKYATGEREMLGNEFSKGVAAGSIGSGDATIWNVALRSRFPTRDLIGPPVVFRIRDKKTGMLLGLAVGLEDASWSGFASALANAIEDKVTFCERFGIQISTDQWPAIGLPAVIEADCGETDNKKPNLFVEETGTRVTNLWRGRPDMKPGVESDFRTLQVSMNECTPGTLVERWQDYSGSTWQTKAELDIEQFTRRLIREELERMKKPRGGIYLPSEMIAAGVNTSPLSMWNWSVRREGGGLRTFDPNIVKLSLLDREFAAITPHGVEFRGIQYIAKELIQTQAFAQARRSGASRVEVAFDRRLVDNIYILPNTSTSVIVVCSLNMQLENQHDFEGKSFFEVKLLRTAGDLNNAGHAIESFKSSIRVRAQNEDDLKASREVDGDATGPKLPAKTQIKGKKRARINERNEYSPTQAIRPFVDQKPEVAPDNVVSMAKPRAKKSTGNSIFSSLINEIQGRIQPELGPSPGRNQSADQN